MLDCRAVGCKTAWHLKGGTWGPGVPDCQASGARSVAASGGADHRLRVGGDKTGTQSRREGGVPVGISGAGSGTLIANSGAGSSTGSRNHLLSEWPPAGWSDEHAVKQGRASPGSAFPSAPRTVQRYPRCRFDGGEIKAKGHFEFAERNASRWMTSLPANDPQLSPPSNRPSGVLFSICVLEHGMSRVRLIDCASGEACGWKRMALI